MRKRYQSVSLSLLLAVGCLSLLYAVSARAIPQVGDIEADVPTATIAAELATDEDTMLNEDTNVIKVSWSAQNTDTVYVIGWETKMHDGTILQTHPGLRADLPPLKVYNCSINFKEPGLYAATSEFYLPNQRQQEEKIRLDAVPAKSACPTAKLKQILKNRLKGFDDVLYVYEMEGGEGTAYFEASHWKNPFAIIALKGELYSYAAAEIDIPKINWDELYDKNFGQDVFGEESANISFNLHNVRHVGIGILSRCIDSESPRSAEHIPDSTSYAISAKCQYLLGDQFSELAHNEQVGWKFYATNLLGQKKERTIQYSPIVFWVRSMPVYYPDMHVASISRKDKDKTGSDDNYVIGPTDGRYDDCYGNSHVTLKKIPNYNEATGFFWHEGKIKANTVLFPIWISGENIQEVTISDCYEDGNPQSDLSAMLEYVGLDGNSVPLTDADKEYIPYHEPKTFEVKVPTAQLGDEQQNIKIRCDVELSFAGGEKRIEKPAHYIKAGVLNRTMCCHHNYYSKMKGRHEDCIDWLQNTVPDVIDW